MTEGHRSKESAFHAETVEAALVSIGSSTEGLAAPEAERRLAAVGPNVLERARRESPLKMLWRQIDNPLIWVLLGSAALAMGLGKITDGAVVLAVVVLNSVIGFVQEYRASRAIDALRGMVPEFATAIRDGSRLIVRVAELVPGDLVLLASGDKVPADLRLVTLKNLQVDEAALTGESVPVAKSLVPVDARAPIADRTSMAFGGTLVTSGTATGLVVATGPRTELGRISAMLEEAADLETPLTRALASIGRTITTGIVVVSTVILAFGVHRATEAGVPVGTALRETLVFAIALAVGAIPEGLPAIVTIALAVGVQRMAKRRAIVRNLPAVETLGSTTVICSDKTGTLTRNEMTVLETFTPTVGACHVEGIGYSPVGRFRPTGAETWGPAPLEVARLLVDAALCSDATLEKSGDRYAITGDPTEAALVVAAEKAGVSVVAERRAQPRVDAIPFESELQIMATLHADGERGSRVIVKGAPESVLGRCERGAVDLTEDVIHAEIERLATRGMRVLAIAEKPWTSETNDLTLDDVAGGLRLLGLVGMIDPPREEAIAAVRVPGRGDRGEDDHGRPQGDGPRDRSRAGSRGRSPGHRRSAARRDGRRGAPARRHLPRRLRASHRSTSSPSCAPCSRRGTWSR